MNSLTRAKARIFEAITDNELEEFMELQSGEEELDLTEIRNEWNQTPLHVACHNGSIDVLIEILKKYKQISLKPRDTYNHTPLDLACCKGFLNPNKQIFQNLNGVKMTKRSICVELLIEAFEGSSSKFTEDFIDIQEYEDGKNTPLHWAIYHADAYMAYLVFKQNPLQAFSINRNSCSPFDLVWLIDDKVQRSYAEIVAFYILNEVYEILHSRLPGDENFTQFYKENVSKNEFNCLRYMEQKIEPTLNQFNGDRTQRTLRRLNAKVNGMDDNIKIFMNSEIWKYKEYRNRARNPPSQISENISPTKGISSRKSMNFDLIEMVERNKRFKTEIDSMKRLKITSIDLRNEINSFLTKKISKTDDRIAKVVKFRESSHLDLEDFKFESSEESLPSSNELPNDKHIGNSSSNLKKYKVKEILRRKKTAAYLVIDHSSPRYLKAASENTREIQKICCWFLYYNMFEEFKSLVKRFNISPFITNSFGFNCIHVLCKIRKPELLKKVLDLNYQFVSSKRHRFFDIEEAINLPTMKYYNTPGHFCAIRDDHISYMILKEHKLDLDAVNLRGWNCLSLINRSSREFAREKIKKFLEDEWVRLTRNGFNRLDCTQSELERYDSQYDFCIIATDNGRVIQTPSGDNIVIKCTVLNQLEIMNKNFGQGFIHIQDFEGFGSTLDIRGRYKYCKFWRFIYPRKEDRSRYKVILIRFGRKMMKSYAKVNKVKVYNFRYNFHTKYKESDRHQYEPFRDTQKQSFFKYFLKSEFDLKQLKKSGLLLDYFSIHHYKNRKMIDQYWKRNFINCLLYPITPFWKNPSALRPFTQIAFYHGIQNGFLFGFLVSFTSWTFPLGMVCIFLYIIVILYYGGMNNSLCFFVWIAVGLWSDMFIRGWTRHEKELAYCFDTLGVENEEPEREEHKGEFVIDPINNKVAKHNTFNTFWKRRTFELPMLVIGIGLVFLNFFVYDYFRRNYEAKFDEKTNLDKSLVSTIFGSLNAIFNFIIKLFYYNFIEKIVSWENHKYESDEINSRYLKKVVFSLFSNYFTLIMLTLSGAKFDVMINQFKAIMITNSLLNFSTTSLKPMFIHKFKKWLFSRKWKDYRISEKLKLLRKYKIEKLQNLDDLYRHIKCNRSLYQNELDNDIHTFIKKAKIECVETEEKLILLEQIEQTRSMVSFEGSIDELYISITIQFGYITLFAPFYPLSILIISLSNLTVIFLTANAYSQYTKRPLSRQMGSIGIWNSVLKGISHISTLYNCFLILYPAGGLENIFGSKNWSRDVIIVLVISHLLIIMKFIFEKSIPGVPDWVQTRLKKERNRELVKDGKSKMTYFQDEQLNKFRKRPKISDVNRIKDIIISDESSESEQKSKDEGCRVGSIEKMIENNGKETDGSKNGDTNIFKDYKKFNQSDEKSARRGNDRLGSVVGDRSLIPFSINENVTELSVPDLTPKLGAFSFGTSKLSGTTSSKTQKIFKKKNKF